MNSRNDSEDFIGIIKFEPETIRVVNSSDIDQSSYNEDSIGSRQDSADESFLNNVRKRKRKRISEEDVDFLCLLVDEYSDILNNRVCNNSTNLMKTNAWEEITQKFNVSCSDDGQRTTLELKKIYENMKNKRRKTLSDIGLDSATDSATKKLCSSRNIQPEFFENIMRTRQFYDEYQRKKMELINVEIDRVNKARAQQHKIFLLQEEKLLLEIEEIKQRMNKTGK